jgi:hypothetical protein
MVSPSSGDRAGDELSGERITTNAVGSESDTSGATSIDSSAGTADGPGLAGAAAAGIGVAAAGSVEGARAMR